MNSREIRNEMKDFSEFKGVYPCDTIPQIREGGLIINTDPHNLRGEHWVAFLRNPDGSGEYFDSFGLPPIIPEICIYISSNTTRGCIYNSTPVQNVTSSNCGLFCIRFLKCRFKGETFNQIMTKLTREERITLENLSTCASRKIRNIHHA